MALSAICDRHATLPVNPVTAAAVAAAQAASGNGMVERRLPTAVSAPYLRRIGIWPWMPMASGTGIVSVYLLAAASGAGVKGAPRWPPSTDFGFSPRAHFTSTSVAPTRRPRAMTIACTPLGRFIRPARSILRGVVCLRYHQFPATLTALVLGYSRDDTMRHHFFSSVKRSRSSAVVVAARLCRCSLGAAPRLLSRGQRRRKLDIRAACRFTT